MTEVDEERTEIWKGLENISSKSWEVLSRAKQRSDYCHDSKSASFLVGNERYFQMIKQLRDRGIKQRFVTEVTAENIRSCKELNMYVDLRHLEGVKGNFGIVDSRDYGASANIYDFQPPIEFIYSNVKSFVEQQQYLFETLWSKALPAQYKIKEIEEGIPIEKTEVIEGTEDVINKLIEGFSKIRETFDNCVDSACPSAYVSTSAVWDRCVQLSQRRVKLRFITEVTKENISYCKEMMKIAEVRHLDKVKGNFGISDKRDYRGVANMEEGKAPTQAIRSTVKLFVDQQQYFFETLWNKAIPAEKKIREIEEGIPAEVTEIWYGADNIVNRQLQIITKAKTAVDYCHSSESPSIIATFKPFIQVMTQLNNRGVKQRYITEITEGNIKYCKELAKYVEIRHLDHVQGTLGIIDGKIYGAIANTKENHLPTEFIYSNAKSFVDQQQYFFETLWNRAVPAEKKIREIEEGIPAEVTEIWYGAEEVAKKSWEYLSKARVSSDFCHDSRSPSIFVSNNQYLKMLASLTDKGVKHRFLTEITKENMKYCKLLAKYVELRHLDSIKGNFAILDHKNYGAIPNLLETQRPDQLIVSTAREFVNQQQYFFETLWNKAIPAEHRIMQLEEGIIPESIETLNDPFKIQELANKLVRSAKKEVLVVFASQNEFLRQQRIRNGFLTSIYSRTKKSTATFRNKSKDNRLDVRITVPEDPNNKNIDKPVKQERPARTQHSSPRVRLEIRHIDVGLNTQVSVLVVDRKHSLVIELKDHTQQNLTVDNEQNEKEGIRKGKGLAIYTNSNGLVVSTVSMFELLWTHIDLYEELKLRDVAQRDFINIAAHELRGPIQPILGLSEVIRARQHESSEGKILSVILNSAARLHKLANSVLDVARIENKSLKLEITEFNMNDLIRSVIKNCKDELHNKRNLRLAFNHTHKQLFVYADRDRIYQVVYNLLTNALKFTDHGLISISACRTRGNAVRVSISDSGQGIDEKILPKLFSKFATSSTTSGTGLGLFISQKIIEEHGGRLYGVNNTYVEGVGSRGATFTFILPVRVQV